MDITLDVHGRHIHLTLSHTATVGDLRRAVGDSSNLQTALLTFHDTSGRTVSSADDNDTTLLSGTSVQAGDVLRVRGPLQMWCVTLQALLPYEAARLADPTTVLDYVSRYGTNLHYADTSLCDTYHIAHTAVLRCGAAFKAVSRRLQEDRSLAIAAVSQCGEMLLHAHSLRDDREVVLASITPGGVCPTGFLYASERLKNDPAVYMAAIAASPLDIRHSPAALCDRDAALLCLGSVQPVDACNPTTGRAELAGIFPLLSPELRDDADVALAAVSLGVPGVIKECSKEVQGCRRVALAAVVSDPASLEHLDPSLQCDAEVVRASVCAGGYLLQHAGAALRDDPELVEVAVRACGDNIQYASDRLRADPRLIAIAVERNPANAVYTLGPEGAPPAHPVA